MGSFLSVPLWLITLSSITYNFLSFEVKARQSRLILNIIEWGCKETGERKVKTKPLVKDKGSSNKLLLHD